MESSVQPTLQLYAAGFNAHGQLDPCDAGEDIRTARKVYSEDTETSHMKVVFAGWSQTILSLDSKLWKCHGNQALNPDSLSDIDAQAGEYCTAGDHNSIQAYADGTGKLYWIENTKLVSTDSEDGPRVGQIALAGNEHTAITFKQAPASTMCHVVEFSSMEKALAWYGDPSNAEVRPEAHHMLHGRCKSLLAGAATFLLLMEDGSVYTWGDPRHESLGRPITGEDATPAEKPGVVEALGGLRITKIACGGWMNAALAGEDGALYLWGAAAKPGSAHSIKCLREAEPGDLVLADVMTAEESRTCPEPQHVVDVAVGAGHVAAISAAGRVYVVGDNTSGQLGLGSQQDFFEDWQMVRALGPLEARSVTCAPKGTFICAQPYPAR